MRFYDEVLPPGGKPRYSRSCHSKPVGFITSVGHKRWYFDQVSWGQCCLVTNVRQDIVFCVLQKIESLTMQESSFHTPKTFFAICRSQTETQQYVLSGTLKSRSGEKSECRGERVHPQRALGIRATRPPLTALSIIIINWCRLHRKWSEKEENTLSDPSTAWVVSLLRSHRFNHRFSHGGVRKGFVDAGLSICRIPREARPCESWHR